VTPHVSGLRAAIGRTETVEDTIAPFQAAALGATLDREDGLRAGDPLPPLWHWVYFHRIVPTRDLADNGHAKQGDFIPEMPLPRRMFAGARLTFGRPLTIGERARRTSTIADIQWKRGASGELVFMRVRNELRGDAGGSVTEEQDIVYRAPLQPGAAERARRTATRDPPWQREFRANEMMLFRYSALIFNAHRIHWDRPYAVQREGYPALVVHGQLVATLLADLVRRESDRALHAFRFRSLRALFDDRPCRLCGVPDAAGADLWAEDETGATAMEAHADFVASSAA